VLHEALAFKRAPRALKDPETVNWHGRLMVILDAAFGWIEGNWEAPRSVE
jgi:hypothetical protein